jgi:hypothetical protein
MERGIKYRSRLLPRVVNVHNAQRSDMEVRNERDESLVQGNGKSPLHVLRKDLAEFIRVVGCRSVIAIPEVRQEVLLHCQCLTGLWGTVDKDAVELLQNKRVDTGPQPTNRLGNIAMIS